MFEGAGVEVGVRLPPSEGHAAFIFGFPELHLLDVGRATLTPRPLLFALLFLELLVIILLELEAIDMKDPELGEEESKVDVVVGEVDKLGKCPPICRHKL